MDQRHRKAFLAYGIPNNSKVDYAAFMMRGQTSSGKNPLDNLIEFRPRKRQVVSQLQGNKIDDAKCKRCSRSHDFEECKLIDGAYVGCSCNT